MKTVSGLAAPALMPAVLAAFLTTLIAALPAAAANPAALQEPDAALAEIKSCLTQAEASNGVAESCANAAMDKCADFPENQTTMGSIQCSDAAAKAWDTLLNQYYQDARAKLNDEGKTTLRDAQRAWIPFREKSCQVWHSVFEGGSLGRQIAADCFRAETARRALELRDIANPF